MLEAVRSSHEWRAVMEVPYAEITGRGRNGDCVAAETVDAPPTPDRVNSSSSGSARASSEAAHSRRSPGDGHAHRGPAVSGGGGESTATGSNGTPCLASHSTQRSLPGEAPEGGRDAVPLTAGVGRLGDAGTVLMLGDCIDDESNNNSALCVLVSGVGDRAGDPLIGVGAQGANGPGRFVAGFDSDNAGACSLKTAPRRSQGGGLGARAVSTVGHSTGGVDGNDNAKDSLSHSRLLSLLKFTMSAADDARGRRRRSLPMSPAGAGSAVCSLRSDTSTPRAESSGGSSVASVSRDRTMTLTRSFPSVAPEREALAARSMTTSKLSMSRLNRLRATTSDTSMGESWLGLMPGALPPLTRPRLEQGDLARSHKQVTILFLDIADFTSMSRNVPASAVLTLVNSLFTRFDAMCDVYGVHKVDTAGDSYVVSSGVVIGTDNVGFMQLPKFTSFGDTMNTATRIKSTRQVNRIQVSSVTKELFDMGRPPLPRFKFEATGGVFVKGKGIMTMHLWTAPTLLSLPLLSLSTTSAHALNRVPEGEVPRSLKGSQCGTGPIFIPEIAHVLPSLCVDHMF
ncbi:hypothetical protein FOA52_010503 [Chlamydomonas sp. UWO 241]|nr:hypothetical protein FOA52_010503 [Chlamydomonas sp. UWO 241]